MFGPQYGLPTGRSRRVVGPARIHRIGRGGPTPQPQPGPAPGAAETAPTAPGPAPTPQPQPGPAPVAPAPAGPSQGLDLAGAVRGWIEQSLGAAQTVLGLSLIAVGALLLLSETGAGGELARGARRTAARGVKTAVALL